MHSFMTFLIVLIPVIFVLVYSLNWKLKHNLKHKRLKERFFIKNFIVALGWAIIPFYAAVYNNSFSLGVLFISAFIFLRIFIGAIMFDIRDILGDKARNIQTIPTKYKEENVKKILIILNFLSLLSLLVPFLISLLPADGILIGLFGLFMGFLYINLFGRKFDIRFLCDVIVDGEYVLLGVVTFLIAMLL
jgi:4-hydroxybenzoate polyprenyltransferase